MDKLDYNLKRIKCSLRNNIFQKSKLLGYDNEQMQIKDLVQKTSENGESNSALIIGPRSSGKTKLVNDVINELKNTLVFKKDTIVVKLNGMVHTDDRLALKSITFQMNLENVVDGKVFGTFAENLSFLLACLRTGNKHESKSVIFILEEFDLFCFHHNQTLLYNLFDIAQSAHAPICVLGITCRLDVIELLEKRVKSRFSHRQFFLFPPETEKSLENTLKKLEYYLIINKQNDIDYSSWNQSVRKLLKDKKFKNIIQRLVNIDVSEITLKNILISIISKLKKEVLTIDNFQEEITLFEKDDIQLTIQDLNVLEICLLIAMKHHIEIYDRQPMNFEMLYSRYIRFVKSNSNMQSIPRSVVMKALEHLQAIELVSLVSNNSTKCQKEYQFFNVLVIPSQIDEVVMQAVGLPTEVVQWCSSSYT